MLVVATPDTFNVRQMLKTACTLNPGIETVARTHNEMEAVLLEQEAAGKVGAHHLFTRAGITETELVNRVDLLIGAVSVGRIFKTARHYRSAWAARFFSRAVWGAPKISGQLSMQRTSTYMPHTVLAAGKRRALQP